MGNIGRNVDLTSVPQRHQVIERFRRELVQYWTRLAYAHSELAI
jgi:hypothetical protein